MKATGIVRKVDELGRIVLPIELRRTLDINEKDSLEIYVDGNHIILKKYEPACIFCNSSVDVVNFKGKIICMECAKQLSETAEEIQP
ncbi:MAG: AbrB/MazE/SpoVT family DNA-binding domain-containing protein [Anaerotruncus sp.]|nr:AbrB/MazE/SpoVT family DNA-binding domain-containing protein [Anaerotruncus sp.]